MCNFSFFNYCTICSCNKGSHLIGQYSCLPDFCHDLPSLCCSIHNPGHSSIDYIADAVAGSHKLDALLVECSDAVVENHTAAVVRLDAAPLLADFVSHNEDDFEPKDGTIPAQTVADSKSNKNIDYNKSFQRSHFTI